MASSRPPIPSGDGDDFSPLGVQLGSPRFSAPAQDRIRWISDTDGAVVAEIYTDDTGPGGQENLYVGLDDRTASGGLPEQYLHFFRNQGSPPNGERAIEVVQSKAGSIDLQRRTIMRKTPLEFVARSSFLQTTGSALGEETRNYVQFGSQSGVWPGGTNTLATPVYAHLLPTPIGAFYYATFLDQSAGLNAPAIVTTVLPNPSNCQFKIWNPFGAPAAGVPWFIYVMVILFY